jgi:antitoxin (DNA-binding transcriptional repressor) of toxin-antitoxin stability system
MKRITATELARRLSEVLDRLGSEGEEIVLLGGAAAGTRRSLE